MQEGRKGHFVWDCYQDQQSSISSCRSRQLVGNDWLIKNGLEEGDKVVTEGMMLLASEAPVKIVKEVDQKPAAGDKAKK